MAGTGQKVSLASAIMDLLGFTSQEERLKEGKIKPKRKYVINSQILKKRGFDKFGVPKKNRAQLVYIRTRYGMEESVHGVNRPVPLIE